MKPITLKQVSERLHYLMGEKKIPQGTVVDRETFAQDGFDMAWEDYDWDFSLAEFTGTISNGVLDLPADYAAGGKVRVFVEVKEFRPVSVEDINLRAGSNKFRIRYDHTNNRHQIVSPDNGEVTVIYKLVPPTLTDDTPVIVHFPSIMLPATGALVYAKQSLAPTRADVTQEVDLYHLELKRQRALYTRSQRPGRAITAQERAGTYIGQVG